MNTFRFVAVSLFVLLLLFMFAIPKPEFKKELENADLPWNITTHPDGSTEVFSLRFGSGKLSDAITRFHEPEDIAVFRGDHSSSLEAYFGTVNIGPLKAKLVTTLQTTPEEIEQMLSRATGLSMSDSPDKKVELAVEEQHRPPRRTPGCVYCHCPRR